MAYISANPSNTSDVVAEIELGTSRAFVEAAQRAKAAQRAWARVPAPLRGQVIGNTGRLVEANFEPLSQLVAREIGKSIAEARGEVREVVDTANFFLGEGRRLHGQTVPSGMPDKQLFTFRNPVGVAAIITAGNFPAAVPSWYIIPALLYGNSVVWQPAEYSAASAQALYDLFQGAGIPEGVFEIVFADGSETFAGLEQSLQQGLVDRVGFTGSTEVGVRIGELCGRLDLAVRGALFAGFGSAGQRCTSLGTAIVHESVYDEFLTRFVEAVANATVGDPTGDVLCGPLLDEKYALAYEKYLGWIGEHHSVHGPTGRISAASYGLSSSICTTDPDKAFRFRAGISAGMVSVNNSTSGAEAHLPFGGDGRSGNGSRQSGVWVLDQFTRWQSLSRDHSGKLQKAQMDTLAIEADLDHRLA